MINLFNILNSFAFTPVFVTREEKIEPTHALTFLYIELNSDHMTMQLTIEKLNLQFMLFHKQIKCLKEI